LTALGRTVLAHIRCYVAVAELSHLRPPGFELANRLRFEETAELWTLQQMSFASQRRCKTIRECRQKNSPSVDTKPEATVRKGAQALPAEETHLVEHMRVVSGR
jgi:hypothetical protein